MLTVTLIYESDIKSDLDTIEIVAGVLRDNDDVTPRKKSGNKASIVDINASEIVIFASTSNGRGGVNDNFRDIVRALSGVNLAGRLLGIISFDGEDTYKAIKDIFKDTCINYFEEPFPHDGERNLQLVKNWVNDLIKTYRESKNGV